MTGEDGTNVRANIGVRVTLVGYPSLPPSLLTLPNIDSLDQTSETNKQSLKFTKVSRSNYGGSARAPLPRLSWNRGTQRGGEEEDFHPDTPAAASIIHPLYLLF